MKKLFLLITIFAFIQCSLFSQNVAINNTGAIPNISSMLDVSSTTSGILIPRMTTAQRIAIVTPATGLLVYDITTGTFWYFNGTIWVELGAGGGGCSTLQEAYDCGGAGLGRNILANDGSVDILLTSVSTTDNTALSLSVTNTSAANAKALDVSQTGYGYGIYANSTQSRYSLIYANARSDGSSYPIAAVEAYNENYGSAVYGEITSVTSQYSAIQGVSNYNTTTAGTYPAGVSGYFDGTGMGSGVWGEASGNGSSMGAAVYGKGLNNNFGVTAFSDTRPGLNAYTNSTVYQAAQIAAGGSNPLNPAMLVVGSVDFTCSNAAGTGSTYLLNSVLNNPSLSPDVDGWGYIGINTHAIFALYYYNAINVSRREKKRNITYIENASMELVMNDIDKMKPAFYKYKIETDELETGNESKYRPNMHLGVILDETPDYIQDNQFSGIDIYALATLSLTGVKYNRAEIKEINKTANDFGIVKVNAKEIRVSFSDAFISKIDLETIPTVILTPSAPTYSCYIPEQNSKGFTIVVENYDGEDFLINWIAMAGTKDKSDNTKNIDPALLKQLEVPENIKEDIKVNTDDNQSKPLELLDPQTTMPNSERFVP
jgi:hypothetical protein